MPTHFRVARLIQTRPPLDSQYGEILFATPDSDRDFNWVCFSFLVSFCFVPAGVCECACSVRGNLVGRCRGDVRCHQGGRVGVHRLPRARRLTVTAPVLVCHVGCLLITQTTSVPSPSLPPPPPPPPAAAAAPPAAAPAPASPSSSASSSSDEDVSSVSCGRFDSDASHAFANFSSCPPA
jgi:hypothetical protein